jgi:MFS family permease
VKLDWVSALWVAASAAGLFLSVALGRWLFARANKKLVILIITACVDMMGTLMVVPLLPFYAMRMGASGLTYTMLVSAFSLAMLTSAPLWGRFSDRYGRRPTLLIALGASAISYIIFGFANSLAVLFLSRIVQGAGGGTVGVLQAYIADATEPKDRARALGWLSAATNVGVSVGPILTTVAVWIGARHVALAGHDLTLGQSAPGLFAALICIANIYFAWRFLHESHTVTASARGHIERRGRAPAVIWSVVRHSDAAPSRLIWIYAIALGAYMASMVMVPLLLARQFGATEKSTGYFLFFVYMGVLNFLTRALVLGPLVDRFGEPRLSRFGISLIGVGLFFVPLSHSVPAFMISAALLPLGASLTFSCVTAMLSRVISAEERGLYMGVQQTFGGITRVLFPLGAGLLWDHAGMNAPFWTGAALVAGTLLLGLNTESYLQRTPGAPTPTTPDVTSVAPASVQAPVRE